MAHTPLKLLPAVAAAARARAAQLDLPISRYVAILIRNQSVVPHPVQPLPDSPSLARVHVPCSWREGLRPLALRLSKQSRVSVNALVEALIAADLQSSDQALTILPRSKKPNLEL